jgi:hypothetical protein
VTIGGWPVHPLHPLEGPPVTPDLSLVRLALDVANDLDDRQQPALAGLLRRLARAVIEPARPVARCGWCHTPLTGRQTVWCQDRCRKAALRARSLKSAS